MTTGRINQVTILTGSDKLNQHLPDGREFVKLEEACTKQGTRLGLRVEHILRQA